jgi:F0F1-type ATP synthase assembly protein I
MDKFANSSLSSMIGFTLLGLLISAQTCSIPVKELVISSG